MQTINIDFPRELNYVLSISFDSKLYINNTYKGDEETEQIQHTYLKGDN